MGVLISDQTLRISTLICHYEFHCLPENKRNKKTHKLLHVSQEDSIQLRLKIMKSYIFNIPV